MLDHPRDVFYLTLDEVLSFVEGTSTCDDLGGLAAVRRAWFREYAATPAALDDRFETRGRLRRQRLPRQERVPGGDGGAAAAELKASGAAPASSAGRCG